MARLIIRQCSGHLCVSTGRGNPLACIRICPGGVLGGDPCPVFRLEEES